MLRYFLSALKSTKILPDLFNDGAFFAVVLYVFQQRAAGLRNVKPIGSVRESINDTLLLYTIQAMHCQYSFQCEQNMHQRQERHCFCFTANNCILNILHVFFKIPLPDPGKTQVNVFSELFTF